MVLRIKLHLRNKSDRTAMTVRTPLLAPEPPVGQPARQLPLAQSPLASWDSLERWAPLIGLSGPLWNMLALRAGKGLKAKRCNWDGTGRVLPLKGRRHCHHGLTEFHVVQLKKVLQDLRHCFNITHRTRCRLWKGGHIFQAAFSSFVFDAAECVLNLYRMNTTA